MVVAVKKKPGKVGGFLREMRVNKALYIMLLPACGFLFCFNYLPLFGLTIVFKDYDFGLGIFGSPWADPWYDNFIFLFSSSMTFRAIRNTLITNAMFMIGGTISAVALAIFLNEITSKFYKRLVQSFTLLPYFISVIVISVFVYQLLSYDSGMINRFIVARGGEPVDWNGTASYWRWIMLTINMWRGMGYFAVIYLATISGIDMGYYEAAEIDGANRWQKIWHITLPLLMPTVLTLQLLALGRIMNSDFGFFYAIVGDNPRLYETVDVLDTFIYRNLRQLGNISMSGAASFIQSILSGIILITANYFARRVDSNAALF